MPKVAMLSVQGVKLSKLNCNDILIQHFKYKTGNKNNSWRYASVFSLLFKNYSIYTHIQF